MKKTTKNQHCKHYKQIFQNTYRQQITTKHKKQIKINNANKTRKKYHSHHTIQKRHSTMQASQTKLKAVLPGKHLTTIIKNQSLYALQTKMEAMATIKSQTMHPTMQTLQTKLKKQYSQKNNSSNKHQKISTASITNKSCKILTSNK
ncbi:MAG: hypothetical protein VXX80_10620 [Bacteroidota bacterium]|nr:hypothetical protein [Bacteroidota bacterium]